MPRRSLLLQAVLDHLERQEVVALLAQDPAQPLDVGLVELAVARRRALGVEQALALEEPDLGDRDVGELVLEQGEDLADRQVGSRSARRPVALTVLGHRAGEERQLELADLELVAVGERRLLDPLAVQVGAVERADVADLEAALGRARTSAWRRDTVMSSRKMSLSGWRPAVVSGLGRARAGSRRSGPGSTTSSAAAGRDVVEVDGARRRRRRRRLVDCERDRGRVAQLTLERRAARRAEVGAQGVPVPAVVAEDVGHASALSPRSARGSRRRRGARRAAPGRRARSRRSTPRRRGPR